VDLSLLTSHLGLGLWRYLAGSSTGCMVKGLAHTLQRVRLTAEQSVHCRCPQGVTRGKGDHS
jgi:hypothetical protein